MRRWVPPQQFAAEYSRIEMAFALGHQARYEVRAEHNIRIETQDAIAARGANRLILPGGEANILLVVDDAPLRLNLAQQRARAIVGSIIDDDDVETAIVFASLESAAKHSSRYCAEFQVTIVTETIGGRAGLQARV